MENSRPSYSSFWPLQILLVFLCLWLGYQVFNLNETRKATQIAFEQIGPQAEASLAAKKRLLDLAQDILQLSAKSEAAAVIVKEFEIHMTNPEGAGAK